MAKNVVVETPTENTSNDVLRFVPTDKTKDRYFTVSELQPTPYPSDEDPYPGFPLSKTKLRELEEQGEFECRYLELKFRRPEGAWYFSWTQVSLGCSLIVKHKQT